MTAGAAVFMGSKAAGFELCQLLCNILPAGSLHAIICPDDRSDARSILASFQNLAAQHAIPFYIAVDRAATDRILERHAPRYAFVHGWYQIIPVVDQGCEFFGFHYSPLPRYRGNAPVVWQIINGEPVVGVTLFRFSQEMDEGDIAAQINVPIAVNDTVAEVLESANKAMLAIANETIPRIMEGGAALIAQDHSQASYCGLRTPDDGRINWLQPAGDVHDFIRAQAAPYPGAFTCSQDGQILRIWRTEVEPRVFFGVPGAVAEITDAFVVVTCSSGAVRVLVAGVDGEPGASARTVLKSFRTRLA